MTHRRAPRFSWVGIAGLFGATLIAGCTSSEVSEEPANQDPTIHTASGGALTPPSTHSPDHIAQAFAQSLGRDTAGLQLVGEHRVASRGVTHVRYEQAIDGYRVVGRYFKAAINDRGELLQAIDHLVDAPQVRVAEPQIDAGHALAATLAHHAYGPSKAFLAAPSTERVYYVDDDGLLAAGFEVRTWATEGNLLHHTLIDARGKIVNVELRTNSDRYNVFAEDPAKGAQTVVTGGIRPESPAGWLTAGSHRSIAMSGNNARAYLDADANNAADAGGVAVADGDFLAVADLTASPSTATNRAVAVQNLFYLNNIVHDTLYRHGFNEAAGNFQANNFGLGGLGNDPVNAEAQDGSGTDNANFATPADGSSPRMQMYLWSPALPDHEVVQGASIYGARRSSFGPTLDQSRSATTALGSPANGCTAMAALGGKIAIIDRGTCDFTVKVLNAQNAGASAVIVVNNVAGNSSMAMGGTSRKISIPSVMVGFEDGSLLKTAAGASTTLRKDPTPAPMIDANLDADIVFHEFGHGLTWRMITGMSGPISGAIGEGASDTVAFLINGDDAVAEYSAGDALGIRRYAYSGHPLTYGDVAGASVHDDGEIYAAAMWRLKELFNAQSRPDSDVLALFVDGMNYTPASPKFENMRDGLLAAAGSDTAVQCMIWHAFAERGIGVGAKATVKGSRVTIVESFAMPTTLSCP